MSSPSPPVFRHSHCTKPGCTEPIAKDGFSAAQDLFNGGKDIHLCTKHTEEFNKWYYGLKEASDTYIPPGYIQE